MLAARGASRLEVVATSDERALPAEPARERESQQAGDHYVPNDASGTLYFLVVLRHGVVAELWEWKLAWVFDVARAPGSRRQSQDKVRNHQRKKTNTLAPALPARHCPGA